MPPHDHGDVEVPVMKLGPVAAVEVDEISGHSPWSVLKDRQIFVIAVITVVIASIGVPQFATAGNVEALLVSVSLAGLAAIGMTLVVISGSLADLSVPAQVALGSIVGLMLDERGYGFAVALLGGVFAAMLVGLTNGVVISAGGNPILVTLAVLTVVKGINQGLNDSNAVYGYPGTLKDFANASLGPVPVLVVVFFSAAVAIQFVLRKTRFGFNLYAVGANRSSARVSGLPVKRTLIGAFVVSAALAGLAGVLAGAYGSQADFNVGAGYEIYALTAVVIGGTSLFGGKGDAARTVVGVLLLGVITNVMILLNLPTALQPVVTGLLIVAVVGGDAIARRGRSR